MDVEMNSSSEEGIIDGAEADLMFSLRRSSSLNSKDAHLMV